MATTITWTISQLDCLPKTADGPDYVVTAHWSCTGVDGQYSGNVYNTCGFEVDKSESDFVPYADLTQDMVLGWMWESGVDKDATEAAVQKQIDDSKNPPIVNPPLPWSN